MIAPMIQPAHPCIKQAYPTTYEANQARKRLVVTYRLSPSVRHCEVCDAYHVETNRGAHPLPEKYLTVLLLTAQGFTAREIGEQLGLSPRWVQEMIESLKRRFYALSLPHLIAIVITLGIIDTRNFVPQLQENPDHD